MTIMQIASGISLHTKKDCRDRWIMQGTCVEASSKSQHALFFFRILATVCAFVSCRSQTLAPSGSQACSEIHGPSFREQIKPLIRQAMCV